MPDFYALLSQGEAADLENRSRLGAHFVKTTSLCGDTEQFYSFLFTPSLICMLNSNLDQSCLRKHFQDGGDA